MKSNVNKRNFAISVGCAGLLAAGCNTDSTVGTDNCPKEWSCATHSLTAQLIEVDTVVAVQPAAFTHTFSMDVIAKYDPSNRQSTILAPGSDQTTLLFARDQPELTVHRFDVDGIELGSHVIEPPDGFAQRDASLSGNLLADVMPSEAGALVIVEWLRPIEAGAPRIYREWILLSEDGMEERVRIPFPAALSDDDTPNIAVTRTVDGSGFLVVTGSNSFRFDNTGLTLWKRSSRPRGVPEFWPSGGLGGSASAQATSPSLGGGVSAFSTPISAWLKKPGENIAYSVAFGTLTLKPDGDISLEQYTFDPQSGDPSGHLSGEMRTARDAQAKLWTFASNGDGDIYALNSASTSSGYRFLRQEYRKLALGPARSAPDGSMFVAALGGGRDDSEQSTKLCRVLPSSARCFSIGTIPDSILPLSATQVLVANGGGLSRYDLPSD